MDVLSQVFPDHEYVIGPKAYLQFTLWAVRRKEGTTVGVYTAQC